MENIISTVSETSNLILPATPLYSKTVISAIIIKDVVRVSSETVNTHELPLVLN